MTALLFNFFIFLGALFSAQGVCSSHMKYLGILRFPRPCSHLITSMGSRFPLVISNQEQQAVSEFFVFCFLFLVLFCFVLFIYFFFWTTWREQDGYGTLQLIKLIILSSWKEQWAVTFIYLFIYFYFSLWIPSSSPPSLTPNYYQQLI